MKQKYQPINCNFYDELESLAVRKKACEIVYMESEKVETVTAIISDFKIIEKAEYMILADGKKIRLDYLVSVDGIKLEGFAC